MANKYFYKGTDITNMIAGGTTDRSQYGFNYTYSTAISTYDHIDSTCAISNHFKDSGPDHIKAHSIEYSSAGDDVYTASVPSWANGFKIYISSRKGADGVDGNNGNNGINGYRPLSGTQYWCNGGYVVGTAGTGGIGGKGGKGGTGGSGVVSYSNVIHVNGNMPNSVITTELKTTHSSVKIGNHSINVNSGNNGNNGNNAQGCTNQYKAQKGNNGANGNNGTNGTDGTNGTNGTNGNGGYVSANVPVTNNYTNSNTSVAKIFFFAT